jgi:hypothetical protein
MDSWRKLEYQGGFGGTDRFLNICYAVWVPLYENLLVIKHPRIAPL